MALPEANKKMIMRGIEQVLRGVGEDPYSPHFRDTPKRVAEMYSKILDGNFMEPDKLTTFHEKRYRGMVIVHHVPFYSFCAHHMMPFFGHFTIGYIPAKGKILGLSKLVRIFRRRTKLFTTQEDITVAALDYLQRTVSAKGCGVYVNAEHTCMSCRGVQAHGARTTTMDFRGVMERSDLKQTIFLDEARNGHK